MTSRLVDEFRAELRRRDAPLPGTLEICGVFCDLLWEPCGRGDLLARTEREPAFVLTAYARFLALARVFGEIRYYAAPIPEGAPSWWWSGEDPARVDAVKAEQQPGHELGILHDVADAVTFAIEYLGGSSFRTIQVRRSGPKS
jgi:hypothetical protein